MHSKQCANCLKVHTPGKGSAVYIRKRYYCKVSCANEHGQKLKGERHETDILGPRDPAVRNYE